LKWGCGKPSGCTVGSGKRSCGARLVNSCRQGFTIWRTTFAGKQGGFPVSNKDDLDWFDAINAPATESVGQLRERVLDLEARLQADEDLIGDLDRRSRKLARAVRAILSHAIRRQHLPPGLTFDSELWDRLRDVGGSGACAEVTEEIQRTQSMLRRTCGQEGGKE
jgi:hypothetical protein